MNRNCKKKACLPNRQALIIILFFLTFTASFAQNRNTIDSLKNIINNKKAKDTTIIHSYLNLYWEYKNYNLDTALYYSDSALKKSLKIDYIKGIAKAYMQKGIIMAYLYDYKQADSLFNIALSNYKEINDQTGIMDCYISLSAISCYKKENYLVIDYSLKALKIAEEKSLIKKKGLIFNNIGIAYINIGDYEKAIKYELDALRIYKKFDGKRQTARCNINIGCIFIEMNEFDKALEYLNEALKLFVELKEIKMQGACLLNIARVYSGQKKYDKALKYHNNNLKLLKKHKDLRGISLSYSNIGYIYYKTGKYDKANEYYNKSLEISKQAEDKNRIAECYSQISLLEIKQKNYKLAEKYCLKSIDFFEKNNALDKQRKSLEKLATIYNLTGKYQKAYNITIKAGELKDSVFNIEKAKKIAQLEERYLNEKKDKQIQSLEYENNINIIKIKHHKKTHIIYITGLLLTLIAITIILILFRKKNSAYRFLVSKNLDVLSKEKELKNVKEKLQPGNTSSQNIVPDDKKEKILEHLETLLDREKIYIKTDLTLNKLAKHLSTNRVYLSKIINDEFGGNFSDYINEYRVKEAMHILSDPQKNIKFSIEAIAQEAGFNSKSSFNFNFKKYAGITPSNFKDNINRF